MGHDDNYYMNRAIELARKGTGYTMSNPLVGSVIVKDGEIIGEGYHKKFGENHAEVNAIEDGLSKVKTLEGSTLYVNLEPCSHSGKTPPCAERIVRENIKRVVVGTRDPYKKVAGRGINILKNAGIEVTEGILEEECIDLNERFFTYIKKDRPFVVLKSAITLDGKIATATGSSQWITSEESRAMSHELRGRLDGIMVGINTVLHDDPSLNVRHGKYKNSPIRIIVDSSLKIPTDSKVLSKDLDSYTIIATTEFCDKEKLKELKLLENVKVVIADEKDGQVDLENLMEKLKEYNISSILLEGGGTLNASMLRENLVDKVHIFIASKIIGGDGKNAFGSIGIENIDDALNLKDMKVEMLSTDILITGRM